MTHFQSGIIALSQLPVLAELSGTVAVVGASGMVGTALTQVLAQANARRPKPFDLLAVSRSPRSVPAGVRPIQGDVGDRSFVRSLPPIDWLFYLAGSTSNFQERSHETLVSGSVGISHCLEAGLGRSGLVFASSTRVYGRYPGDGWLEEDHAAVVQAMDPDNLYDCAKRWGESACGQHAERGLPAKVARLTNLYGPHLAPGSTTVLSEWLAEARTHGRISLRGHAESVRNYAYVLDAVQGLLLVAVAGRPGEAYNIGSTEHFSNRQLAGMIAKALDVPVLESPAAGPPSINRISIAKAQHELGFQPRYELEPLLPEWIADEVKSACTTSPN